MNKYYLIHDNSVQWFSFVVKITESNPDSHGVWMVAESHSINPLPNSPVVNQICKRETHFTNRSFQMAGGPHFRESYYGWTISQKEFDNLARACQLWKSWKEFRDILELP